MSPPLRFACHLGANLTTLSSAVVAALGAAGLAASDHTADTVTSDDAIERRADLDIVWWCGGLHRMLGRDGTATHRAVVAPVFPDATTPTYHSVLIAREGTRTAPVDRAGRLAVNEWASWSGHHALRHHLGGEWPGPTLHTGGHVASIDAVRAGEADLAAIDHTVWAHHHERHDGLTIVDRTRSWPSPPVAVAVGLDDDVADRIVAALLGLTGLPGVVRFAPTDDDAYVVMEPLR